MKRSARAVKLWLINVFTFVLFCLLSITGLINWLLPQGYQAPRGSLLVSLRHFLTQVHEYCAVLFMVLIVIHIFLHWGYIKANLNRGSEKK